MNFFQETGQAEILGERKPVECLYAADKWLSDSAGEDVVVNNIIYCYDKEIIITPGENISTFWTRMGDTEIQRAVECAKSLTLSAADFAKLFVGRELLFWINMREGDSDTKEIEDQIIEIKKRIIDSLVISVGKEYSLWSGIKIDGIDDRVDENGEINHINVMDELFVEKFALGVMGEYVRARVNSGNNNFLFTEEGKSLALTALKQIQSNLEHEDWDKTVSTLIKVIENKDGLNGFSFEELLDQAHGNDMVISEVVSTKERDDCKFILAVRNSKRYGLMRCWDYLPMSFRQKMSEHLGGLFDATNKLGSFEIEQVAESIAKPETVGLKIQLAFAVMEHEKDPELKARLAKELLKYHINVNLGYREACEFYKKDGGKVVRRLDMDY